MIDIAQWRASVGLYNSSKPYHFKFACHSNILIHITIGLYFHFLPILFLFKPCMLLLSITYSYLHSLTSNHWLVLMNAFLLYNLSIRLTTLSGDIHPNPGPNNSSIPASNNSNNFSVFHLNIRSIKANKKLSDLIDFTTVQHDFDLITLSETFLGPIVRDDEISIPGYDLYRKDRNRHGGGVCMYIKSCIPHKLITDYDNPLHESIWLELYLGKFKHLVGTFYRPPGQPAAEADLFLDAFQTCIDLAHRKHYTSINILGDFNDRCVIWDSPHQHSELKTNSSTSLNH